MFIIIMLGDRGGGETMKLIIIYPESLPLTLPLRFNRLQHPCRAELGLGEFYHSNEKKTPLAELSLARPRGIRRISCTYAYIYICIYTHMLVPGLRWEEN
jgi:hypothetical protein